MWYSSPGWCLGRWRAVIAESGACAPYRRIECPYTHTRHPLPLLSSQLLNAVVDGIGAALRFVHCQDYDTTHGWQRAARASEQDGQGCERDEIRPVDYFVWCKVRTVVVRLGIVLPVVCLGSLRVNLLSGKIATTPPRADHCRMQARAGAPLAARNSRMDNPRSISWQVQ